MSRVENERAQREALSSRASTSADRARFWANLNRYLSAEAEGQHRHAREDVEEERDEHGTVDDRPARGEDDGS